MDYYHKHYQSGETRLMLHIFKDPARDVRGRLNHSHVHLQELETLSDGIMFWNHSKCIQHQNEAGIQTVQKFMTLS